MCGLFIFGFVLVFCFFFLVCKCLISNKEIQTETVEDLAFGRDIKLLWAGKRKVNLQVIRMPGRKNKTWKKILQKGENYVDS